MSFRRFFFKNLLLEAPLPVYFLLYIPSLYHNFSYTFVPKMHLPAMESSVLLTTVWQSDSSFYRDIVAEV